MAIAVRQRQGGGGAAQRVSDVEQPVTVSLPVCLWLSFGMLNSKASHASVP
jgi:hypothetical protein